MGGAERPYECEWVELGDLVEVSGGGAGRELSAPQPVWHCATRLVLLCVVLPCVCGVLICCTYVAVVCFLVVFMHVTLVTAMCGVVYSSVHTYVFKVFDELLLHMHTCMFLISMYVCMHKCMYVFVC